MTYVGRTFHSRDRISHPQIVNTFNWESLMKLYHFTTFLALPRILRDGITLGEVPTSPDISLADRPNAANLTTDGNLKHQLWNGPQSDSINFAIRLTVEVPGSELTTFQEVADRYETPPEWANRLGTPAQRKHWFYAFRGVKPNQILKVERLIKGVYCQQSKLELKKLVADIDKEMDNKIIVGQFESGPLAGALTYDLKPGSHGSWLLQTSDV